MKRVKVGVMGAGAIGCYVGGMLASKGVDVVFVGRERLRSEVAEARGLRVTGMDGEDATVRDVTIELEASALARCDVVLCAVKSSATAETGTRLDAVLPRDTLVASLQNGVRNSAVLREALKGRTVLGAVVGFNVVAPGGATFRRTTSGPLALEWSSDDRLASLARELRAAAFDVELTRDIRGLQYAKLVMNVNNALGALTDVPTQRLLFEADYRRSMAAVVAEAVLVMKTAGIRPARLGAIPVSLFPAMLRLPTAVLRVVARAQLRIDPEARSSMWDDLSKRRVTEVHDLNGEIVRLADASGAKAPVNRRIVELVHDAERAHAGSPRLSAAALWGALTEPASSPSA